MNGEGEVSKSLVGKFKYYWWARNCEALLGAAAGGEQSSQLSCLQDLGDQMMVNAKPASYMYAGHAGAWQEILVTLHFNQECAGVRWVLMPIPGVEG